MLDVQMSCICALEWKSTRCFRLFVAAVFKNKPITGRVSLVASTSRLLLIIFPRDFFVKNVNFILQM